MHEKNAKYLHFCKYQIRREPVSMSRKYDWRTGCDVEATLCVLGGRWKPVLLFHLLDGPKRFGELCRLTPNATQRMITLQLRELEEDGVVIRTVYPEVPPHVDYRLSEFGKTLEPLLLSMRSWGEDFKRRQSGLQSETSELSRETS